MGIAHADIELLNGEDLISARHGQLADEQVRRVRVESVVDTGAFMLSINEPIRAELGLPTVEQALVRLADGSRITVDVVGPVELRFANRRVNLDAVVMPGNAEVLLGANALEHMDVLVDPLRQRLIVNPAHPDRPEFLMVGMRPNPVHPDVFSDMS